MLNAKIYVEKLNSKILFLDAESVVAIEGAGITISEMSSIFTLLSEFGKEYRDNTSKEVSITHKDINDSRYTTEYFKSNPIPDNIRGLIVNKLGKMSAYDLASIFNKHIFYSKLMGLDEGWNSETLASKILDCFYWYVETEFGILKRVKLDSKYSINVAIIKTFEECGDYEQSRRNFTRAEVISDNNKIITILGSEIIVSLVESNEQIKNKLYEDMLIKASLIYKNNKVYDTELFYRYLEC